MLDQSNDSALQHGSVRRGRDSNGVDGCLSVLLEIWGGDLDAGTTLLVAEYLPPNFLASELLHDGTDVFSDIKAVVESFIPGDSAFSAISVSC